MLKRTLSWIVVALATFGVTLSALLIRPADIWELLLGFFVGTLAALQWILLAASLALLAVAARLGMSRWQRNLSVALAALTVVIAIAVVVRDNRAFARSNVRLQSGPASLEGTLYLPRGDRGVKRPAIMIIHGSGPIRRGAYHQMARRFAARGFLVLNMDKRGVGGSAGAYFGDDLGTGVIEQRALDARPALDYLAARSDVDTARIGLFSISQGGWVVPLLLDGTSAARYAINFSGVAVSSAEEGRWSKWAGEQQDHFGFKPPLTPFPELDARIRRVAPGDFDPRAALAKMKAPSLWLFGEWDSSAPTLASLRVLDTLRSAGIPVSSHVFPEANHGLFVVRGPRGSRNANFAAGVWDSVFAFTDRIALTSNGHAVGMMRGAARNQ